MQVTIDGTSIEVPIVINGYELKGKAGIDPQRQVWRTTADNEPEECIHDYATGGVVVRDGDVFWTSPPAHF